MLKFQIYSFVGSWPWCFALAYVGMLLGARWDSDPTLRRLFHEFDAVIGAVLVAGLTWFVWSRWREVRQDKH
jgi:membrane protein DedA with SNARE-associated domain